MYFGRFCFCSSIVATGGSRLLLALALKGECTMVLSVNGVVTTTGMQWILWMMPCSRHGGGRLMRSTVSPWYWTLARCATFVCVRCTLKSFQYASFTGGRSTFSVECLVNGAHRLGSIEEVFALFVECVPRCLAIIGTNVCLMDIGI